MTSSKTYEKTAIAQWLLTKNECPVTRLKLLEQPNKLHTDHFRQHHIRSQLAEFEETVNGLMAKCKKTPVIKEEIIPLRRSLRRP